MSESMEKIKIITSALEDKFGKDITVINIGEISALSNYFIIATGGNPNQIKAMCDEIERKLLEAGHVPNMTEGYGQARWVLLDFDDVMVHVFDEENRGFYNLEKVWADGEIVNYK